MDTIKDEGRGAVAGQVERPVRPQLQEMEIPIFEPLSLPAGQPENLSLWRAYEALRACPCEAKADVLRDLRARRSSWFDREENTIRRMIDKALDLWPNWSFEPHSAAERTT